MRDTRRGLGVWGERRARAHLERLGYRVLETNYRTNAGEIDIVAEEGGDLVCIEVRTKRGRSFGTPEESIVGNKARRLAALAEEYAQAHPDLPADLRVDIVAIELTERGQVLRVEVLKNVVEG